MELRKFSERMLSDSEKHGGSRKDVCEMMGI